MSMSISSTSFSPPPRPDASTLADRLFSRLDTDEQGFIEKADLESALSSLQDQDDSSTDALFERLDGDSDGRITRDEMKTGLQELADQLEQQMWQMRQQAGLSGEPPSGPPSGPPPGVSFESGSEASSDAMASVSGSPPADVRSDMRLMHTLMRLMQSYGGEDNAGQANSGSGLSVSA